MAVKSRSPNSASILSVSARAISASELGDFFVELGEEAVGVRPVEADLGRLGAELVASSVAGMVRGTSSSREVAAGLDFFSSTLICSQLRSTASESVATASPKIAGGGG